MTTTQFNTSNELDLETLGEISGGGRRRRARRANRVDNRVNVSNSGDGNFKVDYRVGGKWHSMTFTGEEIRSGQKFDPVNNQMYSLEQFLGSGNNASNTFLNRAVGQIRTEHASLTTS